MHLWAQSYATGLGRRADNGVHRRLSVETPGVSKPRLSGPSAPQRVLQPSCCA